MECHRIANSLIRPGQELPEDFDQNILELEEEEGGGERESKSCETPAREPNADQNASTAGPN
jgi:hypothetical protein